MRHFYLDTETRLFAPGYMAPKIVCLQYCFDTGPAVLLHGRADRTKMLDLVRDCLRDPGCTLVGHNVAFDLVCLAAEDPDLLPLIFAAHEGKANGN